MKRIISNFVVTSILLGGLCFPGNQAAMAGPETGKPAAKKANPEKISWVSYDEGLAQAKKEGKHILIDFYTTWCGWCKKMDRSTFSDAAVVDFMKEKMIAIKVNGESPKPAIHEDRPFTERTLTRDIYGVRGFPTYFFLNPQGKALYKVPGYKGPADFLNLVEYVGESHYKKSSFPAFVEAKKTTGAQQIDIQ
jgi:thioredoxin-related protein